MQYYRRKPYVALAFVACMLIARPTEAAIITILDDSTTAFTGTFELTGAELVPLLRPVNFRYFPTDISQLEPSHITIARGTTSRIGTNDPGGNSLHAVGGNPDDPYALFSNVLPFGPLSLAGSYINALPFLINDFFIDYTIASPIYWSYLNLTDTGGANGTFSGSFSFRFVPEGGTSALMLSLGVLGLAGLGRWLNRRF